MRGFEVWGYSGPAAEVEPHWPQGVALRRDRSCRGSRLTAAPDAAEPSPPTQKKAKLIIKVTQGTQLWYFGGFAAPSSFTDGATQVTLTALGQNTGTFQWDITAGTDKVYLENNQTSVSKTNDNTLLVTASGPSKASNDVSIRLTYNGTQTATKKLSVREPYTLEARVPAGPVDFGRNTCADLTTTMNLGTTGYLSIVGYNILDQFGGLVKNAGGSEFLGTKSDSQTNNWPSGTAFSFAGVDGSFVDEICVPATNAVGTPLVPIPQAPSTLVDANPVDVTPQQWTIGSTGLGLGGILVQTDGLTRYIDHGRHKNIVTPATP